MIRQYARIAWCFNTQPRRGGCSIWVGCWSGSPISFNTQPRRGGCVIIGDHIRRHCLFQHTAAQRRLRITPINGAVKEVFQHTAAQRRLLYNTVDGKLYICFNTQPRRGGCIMHPVEYTTANRVSTHSRAEAAAVDRR